MFTYIIKKTSQEYLKSLDSSFLVQNMRYHIEEYRHIVIPIVTSAKLITPDAFQISFKNQLEETDQQTILKSVLRVINEISIKNHTAEFCPICHKPIIHVDNFIVCLNIDCFNNINTVKTRMICLFPEISFRLMSQVIDDIVEYHKCELTVSSVIDYLISNSTNNQLLVESLINCICDMRLDFFLTALLGSPIPDEIDEIVKKYNNRLIFMIEDESTDFRLLREFSRRAFDICSTAAVVNSDFVKIVQKF